MGTESEKYYWMTQSDWISQYTAKAADFLPADKRYGWRTLTLKIKKVQGSGIQLSVRFINSVGSDHSAQATAVAAQAAKELLELHHGITWQLIEARFNQTQNTLDGGKTKVSCQIVCS
jgi:hypothetical protein